MTLIELVFRLLCGHALADFALQSDFIAKNKARGSGIFWPYVLTSHALIHGLLVYWATGSPVLGIAETGAHWVIDFGKCEGWYGLHVDQALHLLSKVAWVGCIWYLA